MNFSRVVRLVLWCFPSVHAERLARYLISHRNLIENTVLVSVYYFFEQLEQEPEYEVKRYTKSLSRNSYYFLSDTHM